MSKTALFRLVKVKSGTFRTVSTKAIKLLLDDKYGMLSKEQEKFKENKKIEIY